jgi:hypothetical protein
MVHRDYHSSKWKGINMNGENSRLESELHID